MWSGGPGRSQQDGPATLSPGTQVPTLPTVRSAHLHVENRLLVPILPTIPDRQGVIAPLQVKLLEGQLDHLGREHGIRGQAGAAGRDCQSLEDSKKLPCYVLMSRIPETPFHKTFNPNKHFRATFLSVNYFSPGHLVSGVP